MLRKPQRVPVPWQSTALPLFSVGAWAAAQGTVIPARGRIPVAVVQAFDAAN